MEGPSKPPKKETTQSAEQGPRVPTHEEVVSALGALKTSVENNPEALAIYNSWLDEQDRRRDSGEASDAELGREWIEFYLEAGMPEEAVEKAREIVSHYKSRLEPGEDPSKGVGPDGNDMYWFCIGVIEDFG